MSEALEVSTEVIDLGEGVQQDAPGEGDVTIQDQSETPSSDAESELKEQLIQKISELELKIDGSTIKEKLPFEVTPEQAEWLKKELQLARVSSKRMQEAAELRKRTLQTEEEVQNFINMLKSNPMEILEHLGLDTKEISEKRLQAEIEKMQMSDEERKIQELQEKVRAYEEEQKRIKEQSKLEREEALRNQYAAEYEKDLMSTLEESGVGYNPEIIQRLNQYMHTALKLGINLSYKDLMPMVTESINADIAKLVSSFSVEQIEKLLGEDKIKGLVSKRKVVKKEVPPTAKSITDTTVAKEKEDPFARKTKTIPMNDFFKNLGR
jgi:hypothetical protein